MKLEIKKIGNSIGLILPKEMLMRLRLKQGDEVIVMETPDGFSVSNSGPVHEKGLEIARRAIETYWPALKKLAK